MANTWTEVARKPACDVCIEARVDTPKEAYADARIPRYGTWGYVCRRHFSEMGCKLGTGRGQILRLIGEGEPSAEELEGDITKAGEDRDFEKGPGEGWKKD